MNKYTIIYKVDRINIIFSSKKLDFLLLELIKSVSIVNVNITSIYTTLREQKHKYKKAFLTLR